MGRPAVAVAQVGERLGDRERAFARRIDQPPAGAAERDQVVGADLEQVARGEARLSARPLSAAAVARPLEQRRAALDAEDARRRASPAAR